MLAGIGLRGPLRRRRVVRLPLRARALAWCMAAAAASGAAAAAPVPLTAWMAQQEARSWQHMLENISPQAPKRAGDPAPLPGIVVAALQRQNPDYYFHWVRDSAIVMRTAADALALHRPFTDRARFTRQFGDFLALSRRLQQTPSKYGLGEPRYTVAGGIDPLPWSRPQYDGPALRALAVLAYFGAAEAAGPADARLNALALDVLETDLDFVATVWDQRGFDAWEELRADSYHTRLVQLAALERGARWLAQHGEAPERVARYREVAARLEPLLDDHWDPTRGFLRAQLAIVATDGYTTKRTDLDSEVIVGVVDADREGVAHAVLDDRVQATVAVLEDLYRARYPINQRGGLGLGYGRYADDSYFGGNPWVFITADFATFYYRLARQLQAGASLSVTARNLAFLNAALPGRGATSLQPGAVLAPGAELAPGAVLQRQAIQAFRDKADRIMARLRECTPEDGQMYEQFDRRTGRPASSRGIGWSHAAFLTALFERQRLAAQAAGVSSPQ